LVLLGTAEFGHLTWTRRAVPLTVPAHYLLDGDHVLIHASTGGNPDHWRDREIVALHVDAFDAHQRAGWSMFLAGAAREVANLVRAGTISRAPWLPPVAETQVPSPPTSHGSNTSDLPEVRTAITRSTGLAGEPHGLSSTTTSSATRRRRAAALGAATGVAMMTRAAPWARAT
jgi:hypothetical protein